MKSNKEKVYDFIRLHAAEENSEGVSTSYIAEALNLQRTNVSSILNTLVSEKRIRKTNGRPVLYHTKTPGEKDADNYFSTLIGSGGSLKHAIQLAKAAILYPPRSLNMIITGERGTGKRHLAKQMYQYAAACQVLPQNAPYVEMNCRDYADAESRAQTELFGTEGNAGLWKKAESGLLYLDNIQYLGGRLRRELAERIRSDASGIIVIASCVEAAQVAEEEVQTEFPMVLRLPSLAERPLTERMEMIQQLFSREASHIGRTLTVKEDLLRCLLLYECEANYHQLKTDIRIGCANAYVREYQNQDVIPLYISDFERHVRMGMLRWGIMGDELKTLVPGNTLYSFDGTQVHVIEESGGNIYRQLSQKASMLNAEGIPPEEISAILSAEVERSFGWYHRELVKEVNDREQLAALVDQRIVELVDSFLRQAQEQLHRRLDDSIFYGLCLHLNSLITGKGEPRFMDKRQIDHLLAAHRTEYLLCMGLVNRLNQIWGLELSTDEVLLLTMFLCHEPSVSSQTGIPVILFAFFGEGIAESIVRTIVSLTHFKHIFPFELPLEKEENKIYEALKRYIGQIHQGGGVYVVYDSRILPEILDEIAAESGILIRQLPAPVTTMGIELARKVLTGADPGQAYQDALREIKAFAGDHKNYIVTLCTTGKGGAEELKNYIERYGMLENVKIIPMSMSDSAALSEAFRRLLRTGTIQCVVGTYDPKLFSIPFCSISEVFSTPKEQLPELLRVRRVPGRPLDYPAIFDYLEQQLKHVDLIRLQKLLPEVLDSIERELKPLSGDTQAGRLLHLSCCIDRLKGQEKTPVNPRKTDILGSHSQEFRRLLKLLKPLEKSFHIIINDDEAANILTIIYQL